jgi:hypothetical protein
VFFAHARAWRTPKNYERRVAFSVVTSIKNAIERGLGVVEMKHAKTRTDIRLFRAHHAKNAQKFSSYLKDNTTRFNYKDKSVNAVWGNNRCQFWDSYETNNTLCGQKAQLLNFTVGVTYKLPLQFKELRWCDVSCYEHNRWNCCGDRLILVMQPVTYWDTLENNRQCEVKAINCSGQRSRLPV